jgi:hypothetical protein
MVLHFVESLLKLLQIRHLLLGHPVNRQGASCRGPYLFAVLR